MIYKNIYLNLSRSMIYSKVVIPVSHNQNMLLSCAADRAGVVEHGRAVNVDLRDT